MKIDPPKPNPLLADERDTEHNRFGALGRIQHDFSKWALRAFIDKTYNTMLPVFEHKERQGWNNPEMGLFWADIQWLLDLDRNADEKTRAKMGFDEGGRNRRMMERLFKIMCVQLDEDTFYLIRFWMLMHRIHDHRFEEEYEIAMNRASAIFNYREIYNRIANMNEPLPSEKRRWEDDDGYRDPDDDFIDQDLKIRAMILKRQGGDKHESKI